MNITPPPSIDFETAVPICMEKMLSGIANTVVDEKGRYLHWDKLRHLTPPKEFDDIEQYWAFIKFSRMAQYKLLPFTENFSYILTEEIQQNLHNIDTQMRGSVEARTFEQDSERYIVRALMEEAINSSQLEGASTTRKVAQDMLVNNKEPKDYSERMIFNNYHAVKFINEHKNDDLTPSLILELHKIVTQDAIEDPDDAGRFRQNNDVKVVDNRTQDILHSPPDFNSLADRLESLCEFANGQTPHYFIHPVIRAIIVHFTLAYDHPFSDGNGRTARALFYWVILKNNYWLFQYITLSKYIKAASAHYGESFLMSETDNFDLTYFINSQLKFIDQAINGLFDYVDKKQKQMQETTNLLRFYLSDGLLNSRQLMLIDQALKSPGTIYMIESHKTSHHISYATAKSDLEKLVKLGFLHQSKRGRAFIFISANNLEQQIKSYK